MCPIKKLEIMKRSDRIPTFLKMISSDEMESFVGSKYISLSISLANSMAITSTLNLMQCQQNEKNVAIIKIILLTHYAHMFIHEHSQMYKRTPKEDYTHPCSRRDDEQV